MEELVPDEGLRDTDRVSVRYVGQPYGDRVSPRVTAWVRVTRWHGWNVGHPVEDDADLSR